MDSSQGFILLFSLKSMLLLLLSRFSRVRLCATPQTAAHEAPPSLGFSRREQQQQLLTASRLVTLVQLFTCLTVIPLLPSLLLLPYFLTWRNSVLSS